jgi:hypothetical protein
MNKIAPICFFVYARLDETKKSIEALKANFLSSQSDLYIFSDGPKNHLASDKVNAVREYIKGIDGFKKLTIIENEANKGLAESIISGVTSIVNTYGKAIILEDDLLTSKNFLDYMNHALNFYENHEKVLSISAFSFPMKYPEDYPFDAAFGPRVSSWGWATWQEKWNKVDWEVRDYKSFQFNPIKRWQFNRGGSDLSHMLDKQMSGKINSWAIRFCYHHYKYNMLNLFPRVSKIQNIGFGVEAEHCDVEIFNNVLDESLKTSFHFPLPVKPNPKILSEFRKHRSYLTRAKRVLKRMQKKYLNK